MRTLFFEFYPTPLPCCFLSPPQLLFLLSCFFDQKGDRGATFDALFYLMILRIYTCPVLVPQYQNDVFSMQQGITFIELLRSDRQCGSFWYSDLISHTQTHVNTQRHTAHSGASRLAHPYKNIFTPLVMCSQQLSLLNCMNNSDTKNLLSIMSFYSKIKKVIYLLIRCCKTRFFL